MSRELPLFPLATVLFPGGPLQLKVFEPRYLDMVASVLRADNRFGVVAIRAGSEIGDAETFSVGTSAEIVDWQDVGGVLAISALGRESFRIEQTSRRPDGLYVGRVELLEDLKAAPLTAEHARLAGLLKSLLAELPIYAPIATAYDDATWVGARLAEILPLSLALKQTVLETRDPRERLERIAAGIRAEPKLA